MIIRSVRHRGLRRLLLDDDARSLRPELANRIRKVLTVLVLADEMDEFLVSTPPGWRVHKLSGKRRQERSIPVSGNWRIAFKEENGHIDGLNLEDYR